jgi:pSer/pThr/pTyr-binding forkhead associated (FHA) protein
MPNYVTEYLEELVRLGLVRFKSEYPAPVLIGLGLVATLQDKRATAERASTIFTNTANLDGEIVTASLAGRVWFIERRGRKGGAALTVGRSAENDLVIPEYSLSRNHCAFGYDYKGVFVTDLGSTNGTFVEGRRLEPRTENAHLNSGDELILGRYKFRFQTNEAFVRQLSTYRG